MKKIIQYQDTNGKTWSTEKDALLSDSEIILEKNLTKYSSDFDLYGWIEDVKGDSIVINALLHVLDIDLTKIQAERLFNVKEKK